MIIEEAVLWIKIKTFLAFDGETLFLKTKLFVSNLVTFLSCFNETLFMYQIALTFTVIF